jgi:hypothetical protein
MSKPATDALVTRREELIDAINRMPLAKQGTPRHLDRVAELKQIAAALNGR